MDNQKLTRFRGVQKSLSWEKPVDLKPGEQWGIAGLWNGEESHET